jgi:hypothetical protein
MIELVRQKIGFSQKPWYTLPITSMLNSHNFKEQPVNLIYEQD